MKYTKPLVDESVQLYQKEKPVKQIAERYEVPERSIIAKLASLGVYKKKVYVNNQGQVPIKKEFYIERIAQLLDENIELLESLEKVNKRVLVKIVEGLERD